MLCVLLVCPSVYVFAAEPALTAENLFAQMEADSVYQQYADLMDTSVRYQDEKEQVWDAIHTAVELQRQVLKDGTETLMPEDMAQYMSANDLDYDMTGGGLLGGNGKLILGVLIGAILGATGATAATHSKKHV